MIKLYPPYIEGSVPAFYGKELTVPYEMNKTVGYKDISGFKLKIITVSTNRTIQIIDDNGYNIETHEAYFNMPIEKMVIGQFYKIQLAYVSYDYKLSNNITEEIFKNNTYYVFENGEYKIANEFSNEKEYYIQEENIGFYSTIGVVKYSAEPVVSIAGLEAGNINLHQYDYVGYYEPAKQDPTEAEIYYQFDVYDYNDKLYASSGKKIHNATIEGGDLYRLADSFEKQQVYSIRYTVWTLNGLKVSTRRYRLMERQSLDIEIEAELAVDLNYDEGYINVSLLDTAENEQITEGAFLITRADSLSDFKQWNELYRFELRNQRLKSFSFKDFTTQQGVEYQYSIQQYNDNGLYSNRLLSKVIKSDFEDCFLYDGDRQLKIRFNPKITSFKNTVLESKVNTIGSKYPFIFRNGNVSYKEFPVGGLISYLSDNENLFLKEYDLEDLHRHSTPADDDNILDYLPTDLVSDNLTKERLFKLEVLEWLTNGEPKLFRSPTEGNYIVRLLNANMTPEQALGRMLHNFTATAYEVAEFNYNNLIFYRFVNPNGIDKAQMKWATVELATINNGVVEYRTGQLNDYPAIMVEFTGMMPGDKVWLDDEEIQIGVNGSYYASLDNPIKSIRVPKGAQYIGFMTYGYYGESVSKFNEIFNIELNEVPAWRVEHTTTGWLDILNTIEDARTELVQFYYLKFRKADHLSPKDNNEQNNIYPELNNDLIPENNEYLIKINNETISIKEIETYEIKDLDRPKVLAIGPDVICEAGFQTKVIEYNIEAKNKDLIDLKNKWLTALDNYNKLLQEYPMEMKILEDALTYNLTMKKTNGRIEELTKEEKEKLQNEIENIKDLKNNPYYKLLTFEEAQDYTNYKQDDIILRDPWEKTLEEIKIEVELAKRENNEVLLEYWEERQKELQDIIDIYIPEDYEFKDLSGIKTTSLYNSDGSYSYQPKDKFYKKDAVFYERQYDYNKDNVINNDDRQILRLIAGKLIDPEKYKNFNIDLDNDGKTTASDAWYLNSKINNGYGNDNTIVGHPGIEMTISEKGWVEKGESYSLEQAYYLPTEEFNYDPSGQLIPGSLWVDTKGRISDIYYDYNEVIGLDINKYKPNYYYIYDNEKKKYVLDLNENFNEEKKYYEQVVPEEIKFGVDTYMGPSDPYTMEIYVDLWIDNSDITSTFEDSLQKKVDMFYYNDESYKDIAYLNIEKYLAAKEKFEKAFNKDLEKIQLKIDGYVIAIVTEDNYENNKYYIYDEGKQEYKLEDEKATFDENKKYYLLSNEEGSKIEVEKANASVIDQESVVHELKVEIAKLNQDKQKLERAVKKAELDLNQIKDSGTNPDAYAAALNQARIALNKFLEDNSYGTIEGELKTQQSILDKRYSYLAKQQTLLSEFVEQKKWLEGSKDFLFNMSEDYDDGGWRSATMKHRIQDNVKYSDIYNMYEGEGQISDDVSYLEKSINYYKNLAYVKNDVTSIKYKDKDGNIQKRFAQAAVFLSDLDKQEIENHYYTNQELSLEERTDVEDILMNAITNDGYTGDFIYKDKVEFDKNQQEILRLKLEREEALKNIPISTMDFSEPERYFLLFSRSHYVENPDTKRPKDVFSKGYCMYQFYDRAAAEERVKRLEINIDGYIKKHGIKETEVEDWLIRNDINERDELLAYLKYLKDFYPQDALSAPAYNVFRPITLNEIRDKKLYVEEELELAYKQYLENLPEPKPFKRLEIGYSIPDFYYKTKNYTRLKECQDRIIELNKVLADIEDWRNTNPDQVISDLLEQIKKYGDSLEGNRQEINTLYSNYINKLEEVLEEEEDK